MVNYKDKLNEIENHQEDEIREIKLNLPGNLDVFKAIDGIQMDQEQVRKSDLAEINSNVERNDLLGLI